MNGQGQPFAALMLSRETAGEHFARLSLLAAESGVVVCLLRVSGKKPLSGGLPDLFDLAEVRLEPPRGSGLRFAAEYRVVRRRDGLGGGYARLAAACRFALVVARNPVPEESAAGIFALCDKAADAFAGRPRPDATLFKSLWRFARGEGFPVLEQWMKSLSIGDQNVALTILREPLDVQETSAAEVARLTRSMEHWLENTCQFVLPPS
ncbi:MAG: hypothetical protein LBT53_01490 [Puniceicoccales bacterium]|jgi:hypothetical protein|nr:hypothetical protein [Puniceicoccales bacterium]